MPVISDALCATHPNDSLGQKESIGVRAWKSLCLQGRGSGSSMKSRSSAITGCGASVSKSDPSRKERGGIGCHSVTANGSTSGPMSCIEQPAASNTGGIDVAKLPGVVRLHWYTDAGRQIPAHQSTQRSTGFACLRSIRSGSATCHQTGTDAAVMSRQRTCQSPQNCMAEIPRSRCQVGGKKGGVSNCSMMGPNRLNSYRSFPYSFKVTSTNSTSHIRCCA